MKIEAIEISHLKLPYIKPLITSANQFFNAEGLLVKARSDNGLIGYGYIDVFPRTGETMGSAQYAIETVLKPKLLGQDLKELGKIKESLNRAFIGNRRVKAGVETALYDLVAKSLHVPVYVLLGGRVKKEIRVIRLMSLDDPDRMAEDARRIIGEGITALKLKVSGDYHLDVKRVSKVRDAVGSGVFLKIDANEAFDAKSAIRLAKSLADLEVEIFEQPVPRSQTQALLEVKNKSPIKIEADQSAGSVMEAYHLIQNGVVDSINTSVLKAGGLIEARLIADLCGLSGVSCHLGNIAGCMVGDAAALQLAASSASISPLCELGEFATITGDPFTGLQVHDGILKVPEGEGLGVENVQGNL